MQKKPAKFRVELAASYILDIIKRDKIGTMYTLTGIVKQFQKEHSAFNQAEAEEAIRSLLTKALVHFDKRSLVTIGKSPQAT